MWQELLHKTQQYNTKALARGITLIENKFEGYLEILKTLPQNSTPIIGITGPPGAGKSTLTDALIELLVAENKRIAVLCIDPSSPFNLGALLGDRIRMSNWYNHQNVFIRSLASRGSLGGLHPMIIEITDWVKTAMFDYIIIETVGVGQSEIEIAGLADITIVVSVPESGDEIQTMKAGLMEIADIFVVNKSDRPDADLFVKNLRLMLAPAFHYKKHEIEIIKTIASQKKGIQDLYNAILKQESNQTEKKCWLLAEKAWHLIQQHKMKNISKKSLKEKLEMEPNVNLYQFISTYLD